MHSTDLAPVLSATSNRDSVWIISNFPTCIPAPINDQLQESVLDPPSTPQTICSASDWAEKHHPKRGEALNYHKSTRSRQQLFQDFLQAQHLNT
jgi:hypothetical protein